MARISTWSTRFMQLIIRIWWVNIHLWKETFFGDKLESFTYDVKYEPSGIGGSICKASHVYHTKGNHVFSEEHKKCEKRGMEIFKAAEASPR